MIRPPTIIGDDPNPPPHFALDWPSPRPLASQDGQTQALGRRDRPPPRAVGTVARLKRGPEDPAPAVTSPEETPIQALAAASDPPSRVTICTFNEGNSQDLYHHGPDADELEKGRSPWLQGTRPDAQTDESTS